MSLLLLDIVEASLAAHTECNIHPGLAYAEGNQDPLSQAYQDAAGSGASHHHLRGSKLPMCLQLEPFVPQQRLGLLQVLPWLVCTKPALPQAGQFPGQKKLLEIEAPARGR